MLNLFFSFPFTFTYISGHCEIRIFHPHYHSLVLLLKCYFVSVMVRTHNSQFLPNSPIILPNMPLHVMHSNIFRRTVVN